jgi:hypothetical protein
LPFEDRFHRVDDRLDAVVAVCQADQMVKLGFRPQEDGTFPGEILFGEWSHFSPAFRKAGFYIVLDGQIAAVGVPQKNRCHHRRSG